MKCFWKEVKNPVMWLSLVFLILIFKALKTSWKSGSSSWYLSILLMSACKCGFHACTAYFKCLAIETKRYFYRWGSLLKFSFNQTYCPICLSCHSIHMLSPFLDHCHKSAKIPFMICLFNVILITRAIRHAVDLFCIWMTKVNYFALHWASYPQFCTIPLLWKSLSVTY